MAIRKDIEFKTEDGVMLRGWLYIPEGIQGTYPIVVMAHGFSALKENYLDCYAEVYVASGIATLVFDHRNFGASDGTPRQEIDPWRQISDYRDAISYAISLLEIDETRVGVWGSSYSGAHALVLGAIDQRIKCVVSQVPLISGHQNARRLIRADHIALVQNMFNADRKSRFTGETPKMIAVVSDDPSVPSALPTPDSYEWFTETAETRAPAWRNEVTLRSVEMFMEYEPGAYIKNISPTPLLMLVAANDHLTVADEALTAYERALEPKKLVLLKGGHFDAYVKDFDETSSISRDWFIEHLTCT